MKCEDCGQVVLETVTRNVQTGKMSIIHKELLCRTCFSLWLDNLVSTKISDLAKELGKL